MIKSLALEAYKDIEHVIVWLHPRFTGVNEELARMISKENPKVKFLPMASNTEFLQWMGQEGEDLAPRLKVSL